MDFNNLKDLNPKIDQEIKEKILTKVKQKVLEQEIKSKSSFRRFLKKGGFMSFGSFVIAVGLIFGSNIFEKENKDSEIENQNGKYIIYAEEGNSIDRSQIKFNTKKLENMTLSMNEKFSGAKLFSDQQNFIDSGKYIFEYTDKYEYVGDDENLNLKNDGKIYKVTFQEKMSDDEIYAFAKKFGFSKSDEEECRIYPMYKEISTGEVYINSKEVPVSNSLTETYVDGFDSSILSEEGISKSTSYEDDWCKDSKTFTKLDQKNNKRESISFYSYEYESKTSIYYYFGYYYPTEYDPNFLYPDYRAEYDKNSENLSEEDMKKIALDFIKNKKFFSDKIFSELKILGNPAWVDYVCPVGEWIYYDQVDETMSSSLSYKSYDYYPTKCQKEYIYKEGEMFDYNKNLKITENKPRIQTRSFSIILKNDFSEYPSAQVGSVSVKYDGTISNFSFSPVEKIEEIKLTPESAGKMFKLLQKEKVKPVWYYSYSSYQDDYYSNSNSYYSIPFSSEKSAKKETIKIINEVKIDKIESVSEAVHAENSMYLIPSYNLIGKIYNGKNPIEEKAVSSKENKEMCKKFIDYQFQIEKYLYDSDLSNDSKVSTPEGLPMTDYGYGAYPDYDVYSQYMCYVFEDWYQNQPNFYEYSTIIPAVSDLEIRLKKQIE